MCNRIVNVMHDCGFEFRIHKNLFRKIFNFADSQKYKFPGIRYKIIIVTNSLLFVKKTRTSVTLLSH